MRASIVTNYLRVSEYAAIIEGLARLSRPAPASRTHQRLKRFKTRLRPEDTLETRQRYSRKLTVNQAIVESSYRTTHSSLQEFAHKICSERKNSRKSSGSVKIIDSAFAQSMRMRRAHGDFFCASEFSDLSSRARWGPAKPKTESICRVFRQKASGINAATSRDYLTFGAFHARFLSFLSYWISSSAIIHHPPTQWASSAIRMLNLAMGMSFKVEICFLDIASFPPLRVRRRNCETLS